ncbi:hypothetical protein CLAIMM_14324 [Cladophialophora immunda]|nr:hypothetical protein CLAIMM_14324 [Cladophialophora immunda]
MMNPHRSKSSGDDTACSDGVTSETDWAAAGNDADGAVRVLAWPRGVERSKSPCMAGVLREWDHTMLRYQRRVVVDKKSTANTRHELASAYGFRRQPIPILVDRAVVKNARRREDIVPGLNEKLAGNGVTSQHLDAEAEVWGSKMDSEKERGEGAASSAGEVGGQPILTVEEVLEVNLTGEEVLEVILTREEVLEVILTGEVVLEVVVAGEQVLKVILTEEEVLGEVLEVISTAKVVLEVNLTGEQVQEEVLVGISAEKEVLEVILTVKERCWRSSRQQKSGREVLKVIPTGEEVLEAIVAEEEVLKIMEEVLKVMEEVLKVVSTGEEVLEVISPRSLAAMQPT